MTKRPVLLVGASMGAIAALRFAASSPGSVAGVVAVSCPAWWRLPRNGRGLLSVLLTQTPFGREFARRQMGVRIARSGPRPAPPIELVGELGVPVAIVHGRADPFISVAAAEALFATAHEPRRLGSSKGSVTPSSPRRPRRFSVRWSGASSPRMRHRRRDPPPDRRLRDDRALATTRPSRRDRGRCAPP